MVASGWITRWDVSWPVRAPLQPQLGGLASATLLPLRGDLWRCMHRPRNLCDAVSEDEPRFSIGQLAGHTGVSVRTIRFWSDRGVLPPSDRTAAGFRRYDAAAVARLELVRTLRELGVGLNAIGR